MEYFDIMTLFNKEIQDLLKKNDDELNEFDKNKKDFFQSIIQDTTGRIPKEIGEMIVELNNDPNYTLMIHRAGNANVKEIFDNGIEIKAGNELEKTASRYDNNVTMLINIRDAYGYKNYTMKDSNCVLLKIPNENLEYIPGKTRPMLIETDRQAFDEGMFTQGKYQTIIPSSYILGAIGFQGKKIVGFEENPNFREKMDDIENDRLVCCREAISSYITKNREIADKSDENINRIIVNEYNHMKEYSESYTQRTESELKSYSKKNMLLSKFNETVTKIKNFFARDKTKEEQTENVDREH